VGDFTFVSNVDNTSTAYMLLNAQQTDGTSYKGKGLIYFRDGVGVLNLEVQFVKVVGNTAWIASQVAEGSNYTGHRLVTGMSTKSSIMASRGSDTTPLLALAWREMQRRRLPWWLMAGRNSRWTAFSKRKIFRSRAETSRFIK
jgi:hypothetical protein